MPECLTTGSTVPSQEYVNLVNTPIGNNVRAVLLAKYDIPKSQGGTSQHDEELLVNYLETANPNVKELIKQGRLTLDQFRQSKLWQDYLSSRRQVRYDPDVINRIIAVYLQWTWVHVYGSNMNVSAEQIARDTSSCLDRVVFSISPMARVKPGFNLDKFQYGDWTFWLVLGGVVTLVAGTYFYRTRKKTETKKVEVIP